MEPITREAAFRQRVLETVKLDPKVPFVLNGKEHILVFNNRAIKEILNATGINLLTTPIVSADMAKPEVLGMLVYWGLKTHSPELTLEDVDLGLTTRHLLYYQSQIATGLALFYPDLEDLPKEEKPDEEPMPDPT